MSLFITGEILSYQQLESCSVQLWSARFGTLLATSNMDKILSTIFFFVKIWENLPTKSMSGLKIIQGLIIYTFPWLHLITHRPLRFLSDWKTSSFKTFLLIHFFIFFVIWFIPSQKSHHYAMPAFAFGLCCCS